MPDIKRKRYQDALIDLKTLGYADNTIDGIHRTGRMIFKWAVEQGIIKNDPTEFVIVPKTQKTVEELEQEIEVPKYLEKEELALLLKTALDKGMDRDYVILLTLAYTGMRFGELCALKWRDINFDDHTISITKTYYNPKNNVQQYSLLPPKTKSSKRTIDVDPIVFNELEKHRSKQKIVSMRYRNRYHDEDFVFAQLDAKYLGYPIYIKLIEIRMKRLLKLAGLNHSLRPILFATHIPLY